MNNNALEDFNKDLEEYKKEEEDRLMYYLGEKYKLDVLRIGTIQANPEVLYLVKEEDARKAKMATYKLLRGKVSVAVNEPNNPDLKEILRKLSNKGYSHEIALASTQTLEHIWEAYKDFVYTSATKPGTLSITNDDLREVLDTVRSIEEVRETLGKMDEMSAVRKLSKSIEYIVACAIAINTSDIHIEQEKDGGAVRYRIDGVLNDVMSMPPKEYKQLMVRMKLVSSMKITSKEAQDGRFSIQLLDRAISIRSSFVPVSGGVGGSFVMRILDPKNVIVNAKKLGLHPTMWDVFERNIKKPNGMVLTTGPTGSGKTTTLYSFLNTIKSPGVKILTLEDPIEYEIDGIEQTQVTKSYSFANGLRSILRQDPDIILVGEIRDNEVAETAIQAALTGHLVFSTLHTNDALGALPRLAQLGVKPQSFSRALNMVIAQRLARILCPHCTEKHTITNEQKEKIEEMMQNFPETYKEEELTTDNIKKPSEASETCQHCIKGYKGRIGIFETFEVNDELEKTYRETGGVNAMRETVKKQKLPFLADDGLWKVLKGETSLDELERVIGLRIE